MNKISTWLVVFFVSLSPLAQAKDVSAQQAGVEYARQEVEKADSQYKADLKTVSDAEILLMQRKKAFELQTKQVAEDKKKAELSKKRLEEVSVKLGKAQAILDQAWKD